MEQELSTLQIRGIQDFIRFKRAEMDLSQEKLAKKAGMSRPALASMELYGHNMNLKNMFLIVNALDSNLREVQLYVDAKTKGKTMISCDPMILRRIKPVKAMFHLGSYILSKEFSQIRIELNHMDIFGFNPGGDSCEIEVKTACYDLLKEMVKPTKILKHTNYKNGIGFVPTRYYFLTLGATKRAALSFLDKHQLPYGLIIYDSNTGKWHMERKSAKLSDHKFEGEINHYEGRDYKHAIGHSVFSP